MGLHRRLDVLQFFHQLFVNMQTAGGIDDNRIAGQVRRFIQRLPGNVHRGYFVAQGKHRYAYLLAQHLQLGNGGRTVHVGGNQQRALLFLLQIVSQLTHRGGFTGALQAHQHDDGRRLIRHRQFGLGPAQKRRQLFVNDLDDLLAGAQILLDFRAQRALFDLSDKILRDLEVYVCLQQCHAHLAQRLLQVFFGYFFRAAEHLDRVLQPF